MTSINKAVPASSYALRLPCNVLVNFMMNINPSVVTTCHNALKCSNSKSTSGNVGDRIKPTMYETRKYGHQLPKIKVCTKLDTVPSFPSTIFRNTDGEVLGPGAGKTHCFSYRSPEYYSYHHMSYYDIHLALRRLRQKRPDLKRKAL